MEKLQIYLGELGGLVSQVLMGLITVDSASLSSTMLFAPLTVCEAFSSLSKAVHSAMKHLERSPLFPGKKPAVLINNTAHTNYLEVKFEYLFG